MLKTFKYKILLVPLFSLAICTSVFAATVNVGGTVQVRNVTNFDVVATNDGSGNCEIPVNWITSPNLNNTSGYQRLEIEGPQPGGTTFTTTNLSRLPAPGPSASDNLSEYPQFTVNAVEDLVIDWTYQFKLVSIDGASESTGVIDTCRPTSPLITPVITSTADSTESANYTIYFNNGGETQADLLCQVSVSETNLAAIPFPSTYLQQSPMNIPCTGVADIPYEINNMVENITYYYHVRSYSPGLDALSEFSTPVTITRTPAGTPPPPPPPPPPPSGGSGGGSSPPPPPSATSVCGNGAIESGEQCDDGNTINGDNCDSSCQNEAVVPIECGNGTVETGETCDDGNTISGDGCDGACQLEIVHPAAAVCGDGIVEAPEACDDGNLINGDECSSTCEIEIPICGNSYLEGIEECDDGNAINGDGCSSICEIEETIVTFGIEAKPEKRVMVNGVPYLVLNGELIFYKQGATGPVKTEEINLNALGQGSLTVSLEPGIYNIGINGESHLNRFIYDVEISGYDPVELDLDYTKNNSQVLIGGDRKDDDLINALDIAALIVNYRGSGPADLTKDGIINAVDISVVVENYRTTGESPTQSAVT